MSNNFPILPTLPTLPTGPRNSGDLPRWAGDIQIALGRMYRSIASAIQDRLYQGDGAASNFRHSGGNSLETWYCASLMNQTPLATGAPTANVLRAVPFVAPARGGTLDRLGFNVTTLAAGNARVGLYRSAIDGVSLYPDQLVADSGALATGTTGVKSVTVSLQLTPGNLYWLAIVGDAAPTIRTIPVEACMGILGHANTLPVAGNVGISVAFTYAALPAPFPAGGAYITAVPVPALFARFSG